MNDNLGHADFQKQINTAFQIEGPEKGPTITLIEATERNDSPRLEQFSLVFNGPLSAFLPQQIYEMAHDVLGKLTLFLVPLGPDGDAMHYQAVINRIRK